MLTMLIDPLLAIGGQQHCTRKQTNLKLYAVHFVSVSDLSRVCHREAITPAIGRKRERIYCTPTTVVPCGGGHTSKPPYLQQNTVGLLFRPSRQCTEFLAQRFAGSEEAMGQSSDF